jgi:type VI secretion system secreted protein VgrG
MSTFTQRNRFIAIETPLGADALGLISFTGHEELGRLFQFETELISDNARLNFDELIGQKASLRLDTKEAKPRYFHGYICRFTQMASRRSECKSFRGRFSRQGSHGGWEPLGRWARL